MDLAKSLIHADVGNPSGELSALFPICSLSPIRSIDPSPLSRNKPSLKLLGLANIVRETEWPRSRTRRLSRRPSRRVEPNAARQCATCWLPAFAWSSLPSRLSISLSSELESPARRQGLIGRGIDHATRIGHDTTRCGPDRRLSLTANGVSCRLRRAGRGGFHPPPLSYSVST